MKTFHCGRSGSVRVAVPVRTIVMYHYPVAAHNPTKRGVRLFRRRNTTFPKKNRWSPASPVPVQEFAWTAVPSSRGGGGAGSALGQGGANKLRFLARRLVGTVGSGIGEGDGEFVLIPFHLRRHIGVLLACFSPTMALDLHQACFGALLRPKVFHRCFCPVSRDRLLLRLL